MSERKPATERTSDLLEAAERMLSASNRLTISQLAREAGIASGTFYLYFPSKAHLEAALIERYLRDCATALQDALEGQDDVTEKVTAAVGALVGFAMDHLAVLRLRMDHTSSGATSDILVEGDDRLKALLAESLADEPSIADPEMAAALLYHGVDGVVRSSVAVDRDLDPDRLVRAARAQVGSLTRA